MAAKLHEMASTQDSFLLLSPEEKKPSILGKAIPKSMSILGKINWKRMAKWVGG